MYTNNNISHPSIQTVDKSRIVSPDGKTESQVEEKAIDLDDVLINELGQFGRYQLINVLKVAILIIMAAFMNEYIFSAVAVAHRCRISECGEDNTTNIFKPEWILNAIPAADSKTGFASCIRFQSQANGTLEFCPSELFTAPTTDCNKEFVYARDNVVVAEFNLGCQEWIRALAGTLSAVGTLLALPLTGYISDRFGRRIALVVNILNFGLFGLMRAFSVNYGMYLILQLLQTTFGSGIFSAAFIFATEFVGPRYRVVAGATCHSMFAVGQVTLGVVAWLVQPWRYMTMALHIPCFFMIVYYWLLPESIRWQLCKGEFLNAKTTLENVARVNKKEISEKSMNALLNPLLKPVGSEGEGEQVSMLQVFLKSRVLLRRVLIMPVCWVATTFIYYGLSINATSLSDTIYLNYILTSAIEIPGFFASGVLMYRVGRKFTLCTGFLCAGVCNIAFVIISQDHTMFRLTIYLLGKFGIAMVATAIYLYTTELYPTPYRHRLVGFSSMIGRVGSITAPLTPALTEYWFGIPSLMFAGFAFISTLIILTQPETLGIKLPDTLAESEAIGTAEYKKKFTL